MLLTLGITLSFFECINHLTLRVHGLAISSTSSRLCPPNTFHTGRGHCAKCSRCDQFSIVRRPCTPHRDTECLTCDGDAALQRPECQRCPPCSPGKYLAAPCTRRNLTKCRTCPQGSYNPKLSYSSVCTPCTSCYNLGREKVSPCTSGRDTVCGRCRKGYFAEHSSSTQCKPCLSCVSRGQRLVQECLNHGTGKNCGPVLVYVYNHAVDDSSWDGLDEVVMRHLSETRARKITQASLIENTTGSTDRVTKVPFVDKSHWKDLMLIIIVTIGGIVTGIILIASNIFIFVKLCNRKQEQTKNEDTCEEKIRYDLLCPLIDPADFRKTQKTLLATKV